MQIVNCCRPLFSPCKWNVITTVPLFSNPENNGLQSVCSLHFVLFTRMAFCRSLYMSFYSVHNQIFIYLHVVILVHTLTIVKLQTARYRLLQTICCFHHANESVRDNKCENNRLRSVYSLHFVLPNLRTYIYSLNLCLLPFIQEPVCSG